MCTWDGGSKKLQGPMAPSPPSLCHWCLILHLHRTSFEFVLYNQFAPLGRCFKCPSLTYQSTN